MNIQAHRSRRGSITRRAIVPLYLSLLLGIATVPVIAGPQHTSEKTASATVSFADLDLTTPLGISTARKRLVKAAQRLCHRFSDSLRSSDRKTSDACYRETLADTTRSFNALLEAAGAGGTDVARNTR